jgi:hypothetical protein
MDEHPRWFVKANGEAIPPNTISGRTVQFNNQEEALSWISTAPRICCTAHKLDDAAEFLREFGRNGRTVPVFRYAAAARVPSSEASHTLSRLVREGRAYRAGLGRYRWRNQLRSVTG